MKKFLLLFFVMIVANCYADRIYIMNSSGFNTADPLLLNALTGMGHTVVENKTNFTTLPTGFTSRCVDPVNGYDWLCFFGTNDFSALLPQIQAFIDTGGKVFYQYEVTCCTTASASVATILSGLTGLTISPNSNSSLASTGSGTLPGWVANNVNCCSDFIGNAFKGLDGLPLKNQFLVSSNINGSTPSYTLCPNFGFVFTTTDFLGTAHKGGITGLGDYNLWYDGLAIGNIPINQNIVNFFFPNNSSTCYLFPPGCLTNYNNQSLKVNIGKDTTLCNGQTLKLDATTSNATYLWQDNSTGPTFTVNQQGKYWVRVTSNCGISSDTINIAYTSLPKMNLGNDTLICPGQPLILNAATANSTYQWQDNSTKSTYNVSNQGTYWVKVNTSCGAIYDTIKVSYKSSAKINLGKDTSLCKGAQLVLDASTVSSTYLWQNNSTSPTFTVSQQGKYWVRVTTQCGIISDTINVSYNNASIYILGNDTTLCAGRILLLNATTPNATYLWQDNSTNPTFTVSKQGTYIVQVITNNCPKFDTVRVAYTSQPSIDLGADQTICEGAELILNAFYPNSFYLWQDNSSNYYYTANKAGIYWVDVTNNCGSVSDTINVSVGDCNCKIYVPNAFTPDNDGLNDVFIPEYICLFEKYEIKIYDRWGALIFQTQDPALSWDGTYNNKPAQVGIYSYRIKYRFQKDKSKTLIGSVALIK